MALASEVGIVMRHLLAALLAVGLTACPSTVGPVQPPLPDAADASRPPGPPASTVGPDGGLLGPCDQACADMIAAGCPQLPSCSRALDRAASMRLIRDGANGNRPLTCEALDGVHSSLEVVAHGWDCAP